MVSTPGHSALGRIDQVLTERPTRNDQNLSDATVYLAQFREMLAAEWRERGLSPMQRRQLAHVNAVMTVVLGVRFPLGAVPWPELEKARTWLADIVDSQEPGA